MANLNDDNSKLDRSPRVSFDAYIQTLEDDNNNDNFNNCECSNDEIYNNNDNFNNCEYSNDEICDNLENGVRDFLNLCLLDDNYACLLVDQLRTVNHASITSGVVRLPHVPYIHLQSCLFDTGSITNRSDGGNYIDPEHIDDNIECYRKHIQMVDEIITLGDGKTQRGIKRKITLPICFQGSSSVHCATVTFRVFKTGHTCIIGLNTIKSCFIELLVDMLRDSVVDTASIDATHIDSESTTLRSLWSQSTFSVPYHGLMQVFQVPNEAPDMIIDNVNIHPAFQKPQEHAEEEDEIVDPVSFGYYIQLCNIGQREADQQFIESIPSRISVEAMSKKPEFVNLLTRYLRCFVPDIDSFPCIVDEAGKEIVVHLQWDEEKLKQYVCPTKPFKVRHELRDYSDPEFQRLRKHHYVPSDSKIVSCLLAVFKATYPYMRWVGAYAELCKCLIKYRGWVFSVEEEINRLMNFRFYANFDMAHSYNQFKLSEKDSNLLSVISEKGTFRPVRMPEGISWASFILQEEMTKIFRDLGFVFNIADNLCIGADNLDQLYQRVEAFLDRCAKHNVLLKWSKSDIGFRQTHFFGYDIEFNKFSLGDDRRQVIDNIPIPTSSKLMAKFLGIAVFFSKFVPDWARLAAPLYKTTHKDFVWTKDTANDIANDFEIMKLACVHSLSLYFPDYNLQWIARTDASQLGVGGVLFQVQINEHQ